MRRTRVKSTSVKIVFDRKHTASKSTARDGRKGLVSVEVYHDAKRIYFSTGVKVYSDQFKLGRVCNHGQQGALNERISMLVSTIEGYINNVSKRNEIFNLEKLKAYMSDAHVGDDCSFLDFMDKCIKNKDAADSTKEKHYNILRRLKAWGQIKSFADVTEDNIKAWHREAVKAATKSDFSVNYDRVLKIYVREAISKDLVSVNPYKNWKIPKYTPSETHRSISLDELRKIEGISLSKKYEMVARDLFVFQANTGLSYSDTQSFDTDELKRNKGRIAYQNKRTKTGEIFYIPLNETSKAIIEKYNGNPPKIGLEAYNKLLKSVAGKAGVKLPISSHWARHTFAMICLNNGMPIEVLAAILGHSDIKTTQIYAKIQQNTIDREFDKLMDRLTG